MAVVTTAVNDSMEAAGLNPMPRLRLGIDGEALRAPLSGVGHYTRELCRELERLLPDAQLFAYARLPASKLKLPSTRWIVRSEEDPLYARLPSFIWLKTRGAALCLRDQLDVFWANRTLHPRLPAPTRTLCTIHDLNHLIVPETMQASTRWSHRLWFAGDLASAHCTLANSQGTADRVRALLCRPRPHVVAPGLASRFRPLSPAEAACADAALEARGIRRPFLLSVATLEPRKNTQALLHAFLTLKRERELERHSLVLVGSLGWKNRGLERELRAARGQGVRVLGYVPEALLPLLYARTDAFVFPSLYEGFGMPVLEARACGARVVVSDSPELREAGGPHATLVQPTEAGIAEGIVRALSRPRAAEGPLAELYSWRVAAKELARLVSDLAPKERAA